VVEGRSARLVDKTAPATAVPMASSDGSELVIYGLPIRVTVADHKLELDDPEPDCPSTQRARTERLADRPPVMRIWQQAGRALRRVSRMGKADWFTQSLGHRTAWDWCRTRREDRRTNL
jgi:hypothetical protein